MGLTGSAVASHSTLELLVQTQGQSALVKHGVSLNSHNADVPFVAPSHTLTPQSAVTLQSPPTGLAPTMQPLKHVSHLLDVQLSLPTTQTIAKAS